MKSGENKRRIARLQLAARQMAVALGTRLGEGRLPRPLEA
jgi:hypothetical protein